MGVSETTGVRTSGAPVQNVKYLNGPVGCRGSLNPKSRKDTCRFLASPDFGRAGVVEIEWGVKLLNQGQREARIGGIPGRVGV